MIGVSPKSAVKFWITQRHHLDREFFGIQTLKMQFPGDPVVLTRETKYYENKEINRYEIETLPEKYMNAILKVMNRRGMLGRVRNLDASARLRRIVNEIEVQVVPEPASVD